MLLDPLRQDESKIHFNRIFSSEAVLSPPPAPICCCPPLPFSPHLFSCLHNPPFCPSPLFALLPFLPLSAPCSTLFVIPSSSPSPSLCLSCLPNKPFGSGLLSSCFVGYNCDGGLVAVLSAHSLQSLEVGDCQDVPRPRTEFFNNIFGSARELRDVKDFSFSRSFWS